MKLTGGYNIRIAGRPGSTVEVLPEPERLALPLWSRRFNFTELCVAEGDSVTPGQALAIDPENFSVPLLAPRAGTVRLDIAERHVVLEGVAKAREKRYDPRKDLPHAPRELGKGVENRQRLLSLGAWQFFEDAHTGALPDPFGTPRAVIVSTMRLEPFHARGSVQLGKRLANFTRGLEHLQSLLEYQPIYLALPDVDSDLASKLTGTLRGYAWVKIVQVPLRYPFDNVKLLARHLGLKAGDGDPVWALNVDGALAVDRALTLSRACTVRVVSLGGSAVSEPLHVKASTGYPLPELLDGRLTCDRVRMLDGGGLAGETIGPEQLGLDAECSGLTVLPEQAGRELLGFMRPGSDRSSYSRCFLSSLFAPASERHTTGLRGERRPCVSCGYCEEVCPAGIMPHLTHKLLYQDELEEAERTRIDLCVACGLCSYVCPSKIDLRKEMLEGRERIREELHAEEVA